MRESRVVETRPGAAGRVVVRLGAGTGRAERNSRDRDGDRRWGRCSAQLEIQRRPRARPDRAVRSTEVCRACPCARRMHLTRVRVHVLEAVQGVN